MTLREYLAATDQTPSAFAVQIGRTRSTVYRWLAEDFVPQWSVMREIEIITGGAVTLQLASSVVNIGLAYQAQVSPMRIEAGSSNGTAQGKTPAPAR